MRYLIVFAVLLALAACRDKPPEKTVFDPMVKTIDKARAVEDQLQEEAKRRAAEIESETTAE